MKIFYWLIILLILISAIFKYFYKADQRALFEYDQEYLAMQAKNIIIDKKFTLLGAPTSVGGVFIGPLYNYFMAGLFWIRKMNPYTVDFSSRIWAVVNIVAIYCIANKIFGQTPAIFSSLMTLISFNFLAIEGLPPLLFPLPLMSLTIYFLLTKVRIHWLILGFVVGFSLQLHFTALFFLPMIFIASFMFGKKKFKTKEILLFVLLVLIFIFPLIAFDLRHNFLITKNFIEFVRQRNDLPFNFINQFGNSMVISLQNLTTLIYPNNITLLNIAIPIIIISLSLITSKFNKKITLAIFWIFAPIIIFSFYKSHIINYYYILQEPIFFLIIGSIFGYFYKNSLGKFFIGILLVILIFSSLKSWLVYQPNHTLFNKIKVLDFIKEGIGNKPFYLSYTIDIGWRGGWDYLTYYYGFNLMEVPNESKYPTYTIIYPHFWHNIKSDYIFGDIGVGVPKI